MTDLYFVQWLQEYTEHEGRWQSRPNGGSFIVINNISIDLHYGSRAAPPIYLYITDGFESTSVCYPQTTIFRKKFKNEEDQELGGKLKKLDRTIRNQIIVREKDNEDNHEAIKQKFLNKIVFNKEVGT